MSSLIISMVVLCPQVIGPFAVTILWRSFRGLCRSGSSRWSVPFLGTSAYNGYVRHRQTRGDWLSLNITGLDWDDDQDAEGNVRHIARHKVSVGEVTEVMTSAPVLVRVETEGDNPYFVAIGHTASG